MTLGLHSCNGRVIFVAGSDYYIAPKEGLHNSQPVVLGGDVKR